jgi:hypothetical protein
MSRPKEKMILEEKLREMEEHFNRLSYRNAIRQVSVEIEGRTPAHKHAPCAGRDFSAPITSSI